MKCNILLLLILLLLFIIIKNSYVIGKIEKYISIENFDSNLKDSNLKDSNYDKILEYDKENINKDITSLLDKKTDQQERLKNLQIKEQINAINNKLNELKVFKKTLPSEKDKYDKFEKSYCNYDMEKSIEYNIDENIDLSKNSARYTNKVSVEQCAKMCTEGVGEGEGGDGCYSFLYKDNNGDQVCILSSTCSDINRIYNIDNTTELNYDLYQKKNININDLSRFPLINYSILQNKKCKDKIFPIKDDQVYYDIPLQNCAKKCSDINANCKKKKDSNKDNNDNCDYCIAFGYNNQDNACMLKSNCYDNSGDDCLEDTKYMDLYTVSDKSTTKVPRSRACVKCGKYLSSDGPYIKFYKNNEDNFHELAFINNVQDMNGKINKNYYKYYNISDGYQIQVFDNKNYNNNGAGTSIWLPLKDTTPIKNNRYKVTDLDLKFQSFKSFKIMSDYQANIQKSMIDCILKGVDNNNNPVKDLVCSKANDYNTTGRYNRKIFIERKASHQGKECIYTNNLTGEGESISDIYDTKDNTYSPQPNDCQIDCRGKWSECDIFGLSTYKISVQGNDILNHKSCPVSDGEQRKNDPKNTDIDCPQTAICLWPSEKWAEYGKEGDDNYVSGLWICDIATISPSIVATTQSYNIKSPPSFKITNWGCNLYIKYYIGDSIFSDNNRRGILADISKSSSNLISFELGTSHDNRNFKYYGFINNKIYLQAGKNLFSSSTDVTLKTNSFKDSGNSEMTYYPSDKYEQRFNSYDIDCKGYFTQCDPSNNQKTYIITHDKIGRGKDCAYKNNTPIYCIKSANVVGWKFFTWAHTARERHYSHKKEEFTIYNDITNVDDYVRDKVDIVRVDSDDYSFFLITEINNISSDYNLLFDKPDTNKPANDVSYKAYTTTEQRELKKLLVNNIPSVDNRGGYLTDQVYKDYYSSYKNIDEITARFHMQKNKINSITFVPA